MRADDPWAHYRLGLAYGRIGWHGAAIHRLRAAAQLGPQSAEFREALGCAYRDVGNTAAAVKELEEARWYRDMAPIWAGVDPLVRHQLVLCVHRWCSRTCCFHCRAARNLRCGTFGPGAGWAGRWPERYHRLRVGRGTAGSSLSSRTFTKCWPGRRLGARNHGPGCCFSSLCDVACNWPSQSGAGAAPCARANGRPAAAGPS
jgi:hypothetical protein